MKRVAILVAIFAAVYAAPAPKEGKATTPKPEEEVHAAGLQWPLPDPANEGDLMLCGAQFYERVGELRKTKAENELDKMILAFGRNYLRKAHKFLDSEPDFKIPAVLCRASRALNSTERWEIRIHPEANPTENQNAQNEQQQSQANNNNKQQQQNDSPQSSKTQQQNDQPQNQQAKQSQQQNDPIHPKPIDLNLVDANNTKENGTENDVPQVGLNYEARRANYYQEIGTNFARLLMKQYRKETLLPAETAFIEEWSDEEAIQYGVMGIYCNNGENAKEIIKEMAAYLKE